ncbi:MAG: tetratricopeptide repeat protein, partial [Acidobacteriota bacterium]
YSLSNVGQLREEQGELEPAIEALEASREIFEDLVKEDEALAGELAKVYAKLGDAQRSAGRLSLALARFRLALPIFQRLATVDDPPSGYWVGITLDYIADLLLDLGNRTDALDALETSVGLARRLVEHDPTNTNWQAILAQRLNRLGRVWIGAGELGAAREVLEEDRSIVESLLALEPSHGLWRLAWARNRCVSASLSLAEALPEPALTLARSCRDVLTDLANDEDRKYRYWLARAHHLLASAFDELDDHDGAGLSRGEGIDTARSLVERRQPRPQDIDLWVRLLLEADRPIEAEPWIRRLASMDYSAPGYLAFVEINRAP